MRVRQRSKPHDEDNTAFPLGIVGRLEATRTNGIHGAVHMVETHYLCLSPSHRGNVPFAVPSLVYLAHKTCLGNVFVASIDISTGYHPDINKYIVYLWLVTPRALVMLQVSKEKSVCRELLQLLT